MDADCEQTKEQYVHINNTTNSRVTSFFEPVWWKDKSNIQVRKTLLLYRLRAFDFFKGLST